MRKALDTCKDWLGIVVGCVIMAAGYVFFINPYNIVPGGVYGTSIVLHNLMPNIQVGTFGYMFDIPLLILSAILLGAKLGSRTLAASMMTPAIMNFISYLAYPTEAALEALDPAQLIGGALDMRQHLMLTCLIGSVMIGLGCGIVVRCQATTGGSDIIAMIMQKYLKIRFSNAILMVDGMVVAFGFMVIGLGLFTDNGSSHEGCLLSFYSLISIWLISRVIARTISGTKDDKLLFIISSKPIDELHHYILVNLDRTATKIKSNGLYTDEEKEMLFIVVRNKEVPGIKECIRQADPHAFVVVTDAYDTFGAGWKQLPKKGDLEVE
ncbi:MAG: YitT family protein [Bacteroidales bacterium]|nr:YitT family protein [Candidatus Liminaster caballi]